MRGFSLIELLVTMAIAGVLAAIALPGYTHVVHRALRQDAHLALVQLQHRQEQYFASHRSYSPLVSSSGDAAVPVRSGQGHYLLELRVSDDGLSYVAQARADPAGRQASDAQCAMFAIDETGRRRVADASRNWRDDDPDRCWG